MGGAVGHLQHLYDDPDLTFGEIKSILSAASEGKLQRVSEKLDGLNLVVTWDVTAGDLRAARNAGDIKSGGMDAIALAKKFFGRGNVEEAFNNAFKVLRQAIGALPDATKVEVFGPKGNVWYSLEVIYTENPNVINYDSNNLVFHGWPVFRVAKDGTVKKDEGDGVDVLGKNIDQMQQAVTEKNWKVRGPAVLRLKKMSDGKIVQNVLKQIGGAQAAAGVSDGDTIMDYLKAMAAKDLKSLRLSPAALKQVVARVVGESGAPTLVALKKVVPPEAYDKVRELASSKDTLSRYIKPIELAINEFAIEALRGLHSTLIGNSDAEVQRLKGEVSKAIRAIESSGSEEAMSILKTQMAKLGNLENIGAAMEGVVFIYKGNAYKFTGAFAPANQILGLFKYGRGGIKFQQEALLRRYVARVLAG